MEEIKFWNMEHRLEIARSKIQKLIKRGNGSTLNIAGLPGLRSFKPLVEAGVGMFEVVHPASTILMAIAFGGKQMSSVAVPPFGKLPHSEYIRWIGCHRYMLGNDVYLMGLPEEGLVALYQDPLSDDYLLSMSQAGLDQLHLHKPTLEDYEGAIKMCHRNGLLCDAYISDPSDNNNMGVPARTVEDVSGIAKKLEKAGADLVGLMTGMTYQGLKAKEVSPELKERLEALSGAVDVPTITEGGVNPTNYKAVKETGVNVITIATALIEISDNAVLNTIKRLFE